MTTVTVTSRSFVSRTLSSMRVLTRFRLCIAVGKGGCVLFFVVMRTVDCSVTVMALYTLKLLYPYSLQGPLLHSLSRF